VASTSARRTAAKRDHEDKRAACQRVGIPLHVIAGPRDGTWLVLRRADGAYEEHVKGSLGRPIPLPEPLCFPIPTAAFHPCPGWGLTVSPKARRRRISCPGRLLGAA
jgi:hypothetical protein